MAALRKHLGMTQEDIAGAVGISRTGIAEIEGRSKRVRLEDALAIAATLRVQLHQMTDDAPLHIHIDDVVIN